MKNSQGFVSPKRVVELPALVTPQAAFRRGLLKGGSAPRTEAILDNLYGFPASFTDTAPFLYVTAAEQTAIRKEDVHEKRKKTTKSLSHDSFLRF